MKVNQHTSYLRSKVGSNNILNKTKDSSTYNIFILGIFLINFIINCKDLGIKFLRSWISRRLKLDILNIRFLDFVNLFNRLLCCLNWILFGLLILFLFSLIYLTYGLLNYVYYFSCDLIFKFQIFVDFLLKLINLRVYWFNRYVKILRAVRAKTLHLYHFVRFQLRFFKFRILQFSFYILLIDCFI